MKGEFRRATPLASFTSMIEAVCRNAGQPFAQLLRDNRFGMRLGDIHRVLTGRSPVEYLPERPQAHHCPADRRHGRPAGGRRHSRQRTARFGLLCRSTRTRVFRMSLNLVFPFSICLLPWRGFSCLRPNCPPVTARPVPWKGNWPPLLDRMERISDS